jgi:hypothetical protein
LLHAIYRLLHRWWHALSLVLADQRRNSGRGNEHGRAAIKAAAHIGSTSANAAMTATTTAANAKIKSRPAVPISPPPMPACLADC